MILNWKKAESLERPPVIDTKLSAKGVFYRRNIEEVKLEDGIKFQYEEVLLSNDFRFNIEDEEEYVLAIQNKIDEINAQLHITKLDFYTLLCIPAEISYDFLMQKINELGMLAQWELCNHIYFGIVKDFLNVLPLGKTEEEIIEIFEKTQNESEKKNSNSESF